MPVGLLVVIRQVQIWSRSRVSGFNGELRRASGVDSTSWQPNEFECATGNTPAQSWLLGYLAVGGQWSDWGRHFRSSSEAARLAGEYSPLIYLICALLILPIVLCFAELASYFRRHW